MQAVAYSMPVEYIHIYIYTLVYVTVPLGHVYCYGTPERVCVECLCLCHWACERSEATLGELRICAIGTRVIIVVPPCLCQGCTDQFHRPVLGCAGLMNFEAVFRLLCQSILHTTSPYMIQN